MDEYMYNQTLPEASGMDKKCDGLKYIKLFRYVLFDRVYFIGSKIVRLYKIW